MYNQIAYYYHLTHQNLDEDLPFLQQQAQQTSGPILELGCGTGRILLPLARAGHTLTGLDNSAEMLAIAQQQIDEEEDHTASHISLHEGDMSHFHLSEKFALCLIPYNTIMHLDEQQLKDCLDSVKKSLIPNGRLIIDTINPHALAELDNQPEFELEQEQFDPPQNEIVRVYGRYQQTAPQQLQLTWRFTTPTQQLDATSLYHYRYPHQFQLALQHTGFQLTQLLGDYDETPFDEESPRCIILATVAQK